MSTDKTDKTESGTRSLRPALTDIRHPVHRIALLILALSFLLADCTGLFFKPTGLFVDDPLVKKYAPEDVYFKSPDGLNLYGWYFRAHNEQGAVLVCHGNVENISTHAKLDLWLVDAGYSVFIFDYRGFGRSEGAPEIQGVHRDAEAALETLLLNLRRDKKGGVFVFGKSLGASIAVYAVAHSPYKGSVKAVVLDSPFSSYRRIAREKVADSVIGWPFQYPLSFLVNDDYSPERFIGSIAPIPVVIIHGIDDAVVPARHSEILFEAASPPKEIREIKLPGHVLAQEDAVTRDRILSIFDSLKDKP